MITSSDKDYLETKLIKQVGGSLDSPFQELVDWIYGQYEVIVLNIRYDKIIPDQRPRLTVILDTDEDELRFRGTNRFQSDPAKTCGIVEQFSSIIRGRSEEPRFNTDRMFVVFQSFERVAREEANGRVSEEMLQQLKEELGNEELWRISNCFDTVVFFFDTDAQAEKASKDGLLAPYAEAYARVVEPYDEFGYVGKHPIKIRFDSFENFHKNYQGNWYYYWL
jgi:hypothetical protein